MSEQLPLRGERLLKTVVNQILAQPETWDQTAWHSACGAKHCVAGWCQILSGKPPNSATAREDAWAALGITYEEADWLFGLNVRLPEIYQFAANFSLTGYDQDGYDRAGFDRNGCDRAGGRLKPFEL